MRRDRKMPVVAIVDCNALSAPLPRIAICPAAEFDEVSRHPRLDLLWMRPYALTS